MDNLINLIREDLRDFQAYCSARSDKISGDVWLNANESPWDNHLQFNSDFLLNRYPEQQPQDALERLAAYYQISPEQLLIARGSDEGIDLLIRLFCEAKKDSVLICPPTFDMYKIGTKLQGAKIIEVPLAEKDNFNLNINLIIKNLKNPPKIIFLCSPNNPTGNLISEDYVSYLCENFLNKSLIVVDEAYIEYADQPSMIKLLDKYNNLVVLRTFSKAFGLAGLRLGYIISNSTLINWLKRIISPYPLSALTNEVILNAISADNLKSVAKKISLIQQERERLYAFFQQCQFVEKIWPSQANFLFIKVKDANQLILNYQKYGFVLRNMHQSLPNCVRISIGTPEENSKLILATQRLGLNNAR